MKHVFRQRLFAFSVECIRHTSEGSLQQPLVRHHRCSPDNTQQLSLRFVPGQHKDHELSTARPPRSFIGLSCLRVSAGAKAAPHCEKRVVPVRSRG